MHSNPVPKELCDGRYVSLCAIKDKICLLSSEGYNSQEGSIFTEYDPRTDTWSSFNEMYDSKICLLSSDGYDSHEEGSIFTEYDPRTDTWTSFCRLRC